MFIIFFHLTAASATLIDANGAVNTEQSNELKTFSTSEATLPLETGTTMIIYSTTAILTRTYIMNMGTVEKDLTETINKSHKAISIQKKICKNKPTSCPLSQHIINNHKNLIKQGSKMLTTLGTACRNDLTNNKHLEISNPIIFSTVMGSSSSTTMAAAAHATSISQAHKITNTKAPKRNNKISNKIQNDTSSWTTPDKIIRYSDQALKHFTTAIESIVSQNRTDPSNPETKHMISLAKDTATVVTTLIPTNTSSTHCVTRLLMTTLSVSVVNPDSRISIIKEGDKFYSENSDESRYLLLPQDSVISKQTKAFDREIYLVKRTCWADQSINASTSLSEDPLFQSFTIASTSNLSIVEYCPHKNSWISKTRTLAPHTKFDLPVTCRITSNKLNCSAVSLKSNETGENTFPNLCMTILEQQWETKQKENHISPLQDQSNQLKMHLICAGGTLLIISATVIGIKVIAAIIRFASDKAGSKIRIHSITPSAPYAPHQSTIQNQSHSAETIQEALRLNQLMESHLRDRMNHINDAVNLNQLMGFDTTEITQNSLEAFLMEAMEMEDYPASRVNFQ